MKIVEAQLNLILESIDKILYYTDGYDFESFANDSKTFDATLMQLQHLGEVTKKMVENFGEVDYLPTNEMIGLRNFIAHEYLGISKKIIYNTIKLDLPEIKQKILEKIN